MRVSSLLPLLLLSVAHGQGAPLQDSPTLATQVRSRLIGRCVLPDGKAWTDCEVHFLSRPDPDRVDFGKADEVQVRPSAKGRFHVELLEGRDYMAWAQGVDEEGRSWLSQPVDRIQGGEALKFVRRAKSTLGEWLQLEGLGAWKAQGPFGFHLRFGPQSAEWPLEAPDDRARLLIPPLPWKQAIVVARSAKGQPLFAYAYRPAVSPDQVNTWKLDKPKGLRLRIRSGKSPVAGAKVSMRVFSETGYGGKPLAGSKAFSLVRRPGLELWALLGQSDKRGECELLAHNEPAGRKSVLLRIQAEGKADLVHEIPVFPVPGKVQDPLTIQLAEGIPVRGRILGADGKPLVGLPFLVQRKATHKAGQGGTRQTVIRPRVLRTDGQGRFSFSFLKAKTLFRIVVPLDEGLWQKLAAAWPGLRIPSGQILMHQGRVGQGKLLDLGDLRLDKLVAVDLRLGGARRDRSANSIVILKNTSEKASVIAEVVSVLYHPFDVRGRATFLIPPASYDTLIVHPERGFNLDPLSLQDQDRGQVFAKDIDLEPFHEIRIQVKDDKGKPFGGVGFEMRGGGYSHIHKLCTEIYAYNGKAITEAITDDSGQALMRMIPVKSQHYNVQARAPGKKVDRATGVRVDANSLPETLEFELSR